MSVLYKIMSHNDISYFIYGHAFVIWQHMTSWCLQFHSQFFIFIFIFELQCFDFPSLSCICFSVIYTRIYSSYRNFPIRGELFTSNVLSLMNEQDWKNGNIEVIMLIMQLDYRPWNKSPISSKSIGVFLQYSFFLQ